MDRYGRLTRDDAKDSERSNIRKQVCRQHNMVSGMFQAFTEAVLLDVGHRTGRLYWKGNLHCSDWRRTGQPSSDPLLSPGKR